MYNWIVTIRDEKNHKKSDRYIVDCPGKPSELDLSFLLGGTRELVRIEYHIPIRIRKEEHRPELVKDFIKRWESKT